VGERAVTIQLADSQLLGVLHQPEESLGVGVLVVVGGPQYRVGSHRQFVQLSRALAREGIASMRFDCRGMGDSGGDKQPFDDIHEDIRAACDAFCAESGIERVVLWGLCDAASAAMMYSIEDSRIAGLVLLNPWLQSEDARARTMVRYYYLRRLVSKEFWLKLLGGKVKVRTGLREARSYIKGSMSESSRPTGSYQSRMQSAMAQFKGKICLILSGSDLTAREFELQALGVNGWPSFRADSCLVHRLKGADHTFSSSPYKRKVESVSADFVVNMARVVAGNPRDRSH